MYIYVYIYICYIYTYSISNCFQYFYIHQDSNKKRIKNTYKNKALVTFENDEG